MNTTRHTYLGIDISKHKFDVALLINSSIHRGTFDNNKSGHAALLAWLKERHATEAHVCMEATGRYSQQLALFLYEHQMAVSVANPLPVYHFGRSRMARTKTDRHDALMIARFCQENQPRLWRPPTPERQRLAELVRLREQLISTQVAVGLQKDDAPDWSRRFFTGQLSLLAKQIKQVEQQIDQCIQASQVLLDSIQLIESIPGIGRITAATVLGLMPEIEQLTSARQLAAFAGVTPRQNQSGTLRGRTQLCKLGHSRLRKALYFPAIVAMKHNPLVKALAQRLAARGKAKMSIIGACMRQLLHLIFGVLKNKHPFEQNYQTLRYELKRVAGGCEPQLAPATVKLP